MSGKCIAAELIPCLLLMSSCCVFLGCASNDVSKTSTRDTNWAQRSSALITVLNAKWYNETRMRWTNADGSPFPVWHTWNCLETLIDYANYSGDTAFDDVFSNVSNNFVLLVEAQNDGNDDALWAGISLLKAYRKSHSQFYMTGAKQVFNQLLEFWDSKCGGGVWWNLERTYKNAITNELFLVLAVDLYEETQIVDYLNWANREYDWFMASGMLNSDGLINDGLTDDCANNGGTTWTYNQGVILGGLIGLSRIYPSNASMYLGIADRIARAVISHLTMNNSGGTPILKEPVVRDQDGEQFKGIFMRYLGQLLSFVSDSSAKAIYAQFILDNADHVWNNVRNEENEVAAVWIGEQHQPPWLDGIAQSSASDLMNAAIVASRIATKNNNRPSA